MRADDETAADSDESQNLTEAATEENLECVEAVDYVHKKVDLHKALRSIHDVIDFQRTKGNVTNVLHLTRIRNGMFAESD